ncbi:MAG: N-acetylglucosamine-6-phosphate deacetylase [Bacillota bacterium]
MKISNVKFLDENFDWKYGSVEFDSHITKVEVDGEKSDNAYTLVPGFIDIHTHGCAGFDTCDNNLEGYEKMSESYAKNGVTSWLFTTMTTPKHEILETLACIKQYIESGKGMAYPQGVYLEGPFISEEKKGAQSAVNILLPSAELFNEFNKASGGKIKVAACAPEKDGAIEFALEASKIGRASVAHTNAKYEETIKGFENGFTGATHLYNAMPAYSHRDPGVIGAVLDTDVYAEIICDGIHVHPCVVRNTFKVKGEDRMILISDSTQAAGMPDGEYVLGGQPVFLKDGVVKLASGTIAGSATKVISCVKNCISWGIEDRIAFKSASINPATYIGVSGETGSIEVGKFADLVLLDKDLNIVKTFVKGTEY